jgi:hypothetical protein
MHIIASIALLVVLLALTVNVMHHLARLAWWIGPRVLALALLVALGLSIREPAPAPSSASAYREAAAAVARATGRPCDYECKVAIADRSRRDAVQ